MFIRTLAWRTTTWLAMVAMMMLFIAPWVSKSVMHHPDCSHLDSSIQTSQSMVHNMHHGMPAPASCPPITALSMMLITPEQAMSPMEEIACGYCQLLIHLPFILLALIFLLWLLLYFVTHLFAIPLFFSTLFRPWEPQHARAPPTVFQR